MPLGLSADDARAILNVRDDAERVEIIAAYRRLALEHHPDRGGDPAAMGKINAAAEVLIDESPPLLATSPRPTSNVQDVDAAGNESYKLTHALMTFVAVPIALIVAAMYLIAQFT